MLNSKVGQEAELDQLQDIINKAQTQFLMNKEVWKNRTLTIKTQR
jgi:hypothetical protein